MVDFDGAGLNHQSTDYPFKMKPNHLLVKCSAICMFVSLVIQNPYAAFAHRDFGGQDTSSAATGGWQARTAPVQFTPQAAATPMDLDLSSTTRNLSAELLGITNSVTINLAGAARVINPSDLLTAAELIAASQVLSNNYQGLKLGDLGQAVGGRASLSAGVLQSVNDLVIPQNVRLWGDFSANANFSVSGNLTNSGKLYAYSTSPQASPASFNANNIYNQVGGLISTVLPPAALGAGFAATLDLSLTALGDIVNAGTITSSGNLTVSAGGTVTNALPQGATGAAPLMQAAQNLNLYSGSGYITNSGLMSALAGNINMNAATASHLTVNNVGGTLSALSGNINVRDATLTEKRHLVFWGGDVFSNHLNLYSGEGVVNMKVDDITAMINVYAGEAHVTADTSNLNLGVMQLTGDPTFYNTNGPVTINSPLVFHGENLAIVAKTDIVSAAGVGAIDTSSSTGDGGDVLLLAGVVFTSDGPSSVVPPAPGDTSSILTITGCCTSGDIDLTQGGGITMIDTRSTAASGNGGDVIIVTPYNGGVQQTILLPTGAPITTGGSGSGTNGDVKVLASTFGSFGNAIQVGDVDTTGGSGGGGSIILYATRTDIDGPMTIENGAITAGSFDPFTIFAIGHGNIVAGDLTASNCTTCLFGNRINVQLATGLGSITTGAVTNNGGGSSGNGGFIEVKSTSTLTVNGSVSANGVGSGNGGEIIVTAYGGTIAVGPGTPAGQGINGSLTATGGSSAGANGGQIQIGASNIVIDDYAQLSVAPSASGGNGGYLLFSGTNVSLASGTLANDGVVDGDGGSITISTNTLTITGGSTLSLSANGADTGDGGFINISISDTEGTAISISPGGFSLSANSGANDGNGGQVSVTNSYDDITVDPAAISVAPLGTNGRGGTISLSAGTYSPGDGTYFGNVFVSDSIDVSGVGTGSGGNVEITSVSSNPLTIGAGATTNGVDGQILANSGAGDADSGGAITLTNRWTGGITIDNASDISVNPTGTGAGGTLHFESEFGPVSIPAATYDVSGVGVGPTYSNGGGNFALIGNPIIFTGVGTFSVLADAAGDNSSGGNVEIQQFGLAPFLLNAGTLSANGIGSFGSGGEISIETPDGAPLTVNIGTALSTNADDVNNLGQISLNSGFQSIKGQITVGGTGTIAGNIYADGGGISIHPQASATNLYLGDMFASKGMINVQVDGVGSGSSISILDNATLIAQHGAITLQNNDTSSGTIVIGAYTFLITSSDTTFGQVYIVIGNPPAIPDPGTTPAGVTVSTEDGGEVFFGVNGIDGGAGNNQVGADGTQVVFNTGSLPASAILLEDSVTINASAANTLPTIISNLDLTNPDAVAVITNLQNLSQVGGTLVVTNGIATGGNMIVSPSVLAQSISAEYIPVDVTATFEDFTSSDSINIDLTSSSSLPSVIIAGTHEFVSTGPASNGTLNVTSYLQSTPTNLFNVIAGGSFTSDGSLTANVEGSIVIDGLVSAPDVVLQTTANDGGVTLNSSIAASGSLTLGASGTGNIEQNSGSFNTPNLTLRSGTGNIGSALLPIQTNASTLSAIANGPSAVYINDTAGTVTLGSSQAGILFELTVADTLVIAANATLQIYGNSGESLIPGINLDAPDQITVSAGSTVQVVNEGSINFDTPSLVNNGMLSTRLGEGSTVVQQAGAVSVSGSGSINGEVDFISDTGSVTVSQAQINGQINGSAANDYSITVSSRTLWTGEITVDGDLDLTNTTGGIFVHDSTLLGNGVTSTITLTSGNCCGVMLWRNFSQSQPASLTAPTVVINTSNFTNNGGTVTASGSLTIQSSGDLVVGDGSQFSDGGGTLDSPAISFLSSNGSVIASQANITGTVSATADKNFMLYVYNTAGLTMGTITTPYTLNSIGDPMGGTTYYAANSVQVVDGGGLLVLSSGSSLSVIPGGPIVSHEILGPLTITNGTGSLAIHLGTHLTVDGAVSITNSGDAMVIDGGAFEMSSVFGILTADQAMTITNTSGDLTINAGMSLETSNPSYEIEVENQSGNLIVNGGARFSAIGALTISNTGGTTCLGPLSILQAWATLDTTITNDGGDLLAHNTVINGENIFLENTGGSMIIDHASGIGASTATSITNTNGNIIFDNSSTTYASSAQVTITKAGTGDITFNNSAGIQAPNDTATITSTGAGAITITNLAQLTASTGIDIDNLDGNIIISNQALLNTGSLTITNGSGNILLSNDAGMYGDSAASIINNDGSISITNSTFVGSGADLDITSTNGNIVVETSPFNDNSSTILSASNSVLINADQDITITSNGNVSDSMAAGNEITLNSTGGAVAVIQQHITTLLAGSAYTSFSVTIQESDLEVGDILVNDTGAGASGSLSLTVRQIGGNLTVTNSATLSVRQGDLLLQGDNLVLDQDAVLTAESTAANSGNVYLIAGAFPNNPAAGSAPTNTVVNASGTGQVYWGTNLITDSPPTNTVNVTNSTVIAFVMYNSEVECCTSIQFNGGVTINSSSSTAPSGPIVSLDLTSLTVTNLLLSLQTSMEIGGTLIVEGGVATGGNVIIGPSMLASTLTATNIPVNVVVTMQGFSALTPVNVNITGASTTTQVIVAGTYEFTAGSGAIDISSNQAGPVLVVASTGLLSSDGTLSVTANGAIALAGNVSADTSVSLSVTGAGTISRTGGTITSPSVSLTTETGSIGAGANPIATATATLALTTAGSANAFVTNSGVVNLATSSVAGTLQLLNNNIISTTGVITAGTLKLQTTANNGNIVIGSNVTSALSSTLMTQGTGIVTINSTKTLTATSGNVNITANGVNIQGAINSDSKSTQLKPNAAVAITVGNTGASSDPFEVSAAELSRITAGTLLVGDFGKNSTFTLADDIDVSGVGAGSYNLVFVTGGNYTPSAGVTIDLGTTHSLSVSAQGNVSSGTVTGSTFVNFSSSQTVSINGDVTVSSGTIQITGATLSLTGTINAGSGSVQFAPYGNRTIALGGTGGNAQFELTNAFLANITANSVTLGQAFTPGGITIIDGTDLSATNVTQYNLQNAGNITNAGNLTLGLKTMTMSAQGSVTSGSIFGGTLVNLQAQGALTVDGTIVMTAGTVNLQGASVTFSSGSVSIGQGILYLKPTSDVAIGVGGTGGSAAFKVTDSMLSNITSAALAIGDLGLTGGLTLEGDLNISANYNLYLLNGGAISNTGHTVTVGSRTFGVQTGSTLNTGTVTAAGGLVTLLAGGTLTVDGAVTNSGLGSTTISTTAGSNGNIVLDAAVGGSAFTTLSANGSGSITQSTGSISGTNVVLSSGTGSLGTSSASLAVTATTLRANTQGAGTVFVDATSSSLTLGTSSAGSDFSVTSSGALTVGTLATLNGDITLVANSGALNVQANKVIFANEGNLVLQNTDTTSGTITIGLNSELEAYTTGNPAKGNVTIFIGTTTPTPTNTTAPANVDVNFAGGGTAYFGANSILALKPGVDDNIVNVIDRDVVFDTGTRPASAITLMGNNVITADPPVQPVMIISSNEPVDVELTLTSGVNLTPTSGVTPTSSSESTTGSGTITIASGSGGSSGSETTSNTEAIFMSSPSSTETTGGAVSVTTSGNEMVLSNTNTTANAIVTRPEAGSTIQLGTSSSIVMTAPGNITFSTVSASGSTVSLTTTSPTATPTNSSSTGTVGGRQARINNSSPSTTTTTTTAATTGGRSGRNTGATSGATTTTTTATTVGGRNARINNTTTTTTNSAPLNSQTTNTGTATGRKARQSNLPVAFTPVTTTPGIFMMNVGTALIEYNAVAQIDANQVGVVSLNSGEALIMASDDTILNIYEHQVLVKAGTIALVSHEDGVTKVRNLYEQTAGTNGLQALVANQSIGASAGTEIVLSPDADMLLSAIKKDSVGRRMLRSANVGDLKVATCEISLVSLTPSTDLLPLVFHSKHKVDRAIAEKLIKMAACLSSATAGHGAYSPVTGQSLP